MASVDPKVLILQRSGFQGWLPKCRPLVLNVAVTGASSARARKRRGQQDEPKTIVHKNKTSTTRSYMSTASIIHRKLALDTKKIDQVGRNVSTPITDVGCPGPGPDLPDVSRFQACNRSTRRPSRGRLGGRTLERGRATQGKPFDDESDCVPFLILTILCLPTLQAAIICVCCMGGNTEAAIT